MNISAAAKRVASEDYLRRHKARAMQMFKEWNKKHGFDRSKVAFEALHYLRTCDNPKAVRGMLHAALEHDHRTVASSAITRYRNLKKPPAKAERGSGPVRTASRSVAADGCIRIDEPGNHALVRLPEGKRKELTDAVKRTLLVDKAIRDKRAGKVHACPHCGCTGTRNGVPYDSTFPCPVCKMGGPKKAVRTADRMAPSRALHMFANHAPVKSKDAGTLHDHVEIKHATGGSYQIKRFSHGGQHYTAWRSSHPSRREGTVEFAGVTKHPSEAHAKQHFTNMTAQKAPLGATHIHALALGSLLESAMRLADSEYSDEAKEKIAKVMREFAAGTLKTSAGKTVTDRPQALAIALSEARTRGMKVPPRKP